MSTANTSSLQRIPSLRSLLVFDTVARHLNQVRAAESLALTQSALSRQIKVLEDHLGVTLFERNSRGLRFTQEGELLYDFTRRAFEILNEGLGRLVLNVERQTLVVSAARSYAERVLAPRIGDFIHAHPWIDVRIDVHRYYADIEASGADISVRLGDGNWPGYDELQLSDDGLIPVCAPAVAEVLRERRPGDVSGHVVFRNVERDYVDQWNRSNAVAAFVNEHATLKFNDSATLLSALEAGTGVTVARSSLVANALARRGLVRLWSGEANDGLNYYAISARRAAHRSSTLLFMSWLQESLIRFRTGV
jgi:DNA-binding transcriptional LysR family regulator